MSFATALAGAAPAPAPPDLSDPAASHPAAEIARRLDAILFPLLALVAAHFRILGALTLPVWSRISRTRQRLARLLGHLAAGDAPRPPRPRAAAHRSGARAPFPNRRHGWLGMMLDHNARSLASQLDHLLQQPGVAETLAASPGATRTLRPLCRMLGVALPQALRPPARPPAIKPPQNPPPQPRTGPDPLPDPVPDPVPDPPAPPDRPLPAYVRAAVRAWKRPAQKFA